MGLLKGRIDIYLRWLVLLILCSLILEVAHAINIMFFNHVPKQFWGKPYSQLRTSSIECLVESSNSKLLIMFSWKLILISFHISPNLLLRVSGCSTFVHIHQHRSKLDPKSFKCVFIGYSSNQKGYKCLSPITHKVYNLMDVTFFES